MSLILTYFPKHIASPLYLMVKMIAEESYIYVPVLHKSLYEFENGLYEVKRSTFRC